MKLTSRTWLALVLALLGISCAEATKPRASRSEAVSGPSQEMSGPSFFSEGALSPTLNELLAKAHGKALRLEIHPRELILQAADPKAAGTVVEHHYRDGRWGPPEYATLRGKGELQDNLFDLGAVKLNLLPKLAEQALQQVDAGMGAVDHVLVRRNLPESEDVRVRVYVQSPRKSGYLDADPEGAAVSTQLTTGNQ